MTLPEAPVEATHPETSTGVVPRNPGRQILPVVLVLCLLGCGALVPSVFTDPVVSQIGFYALTYATMASAWNILGGYTGYFSLGHAAFFGIGGYAIAIICQDYSVPGGYPVFYLLPVVGLIAAAFAVPLGIITLRTRRHVFVVLTIAILFIGQLLAYNLSDLTAGSQGLLLPLAPWQGGDYNKPFYYVSLLVLAVALATSYWIRKSKFGLNLLAIRDDEDRAAGLGANVWLLKLVAFVLPAFFIGISGANFFYFQGQIIPSFAFNPLDDLAMVLMSFTGGLGTILGPALGGVLIEGAQQYFALTYGASGYYLILYGALFLVIILLMPRGIIPSVQLLWRRLRLRRAGAAAAASSQAVAPTARGGE